MIQDFQQRQSLKLANYDLLHGRKSFLVYRKLRNFIAISLFRLLVDTWRHDEYFPFYGAKKKQFSVTKKNLMRPRNLGVSNYTDRNLSSKLITINKKNWYESSSYLSNKTLGAGDKC